MQSKLLAIDTETTGLQTWKPEVYVTHISWWDDSGKGDVYETADQNHNKEIADLRYRCADPDTTVLMFNAKFDIPMLQKLGFKFRCKIIDVMIVSQLCKSDEKRHNLKHLTRKFLKEPYLEELEIKKWSNKNKKAPFGLGPKHIVYPYALADARRTLELYYYFKPILDKWQLWSTLDKEMKLMPIVVKMEQTGVPIDLIAVDGLLIATTKKLKELKDEIHKITKVPTFNPNSNAQVSAAIYNGSVMPTRFSRKTGKPKVDELSLLEQPSKLGSLVVKFRKIAKARKTYLENIKKNVDTNQILRVTFNQCGARTGRFSSSGPNLQNIPRPGDDFLGSIRRVVVSDTKNRLVFIDYSQIELRLAAHFSQQDHMLHAILHGQDLHGLTCSLLFNLTESDSDWPEFRFISKTLNFAVLYGAGADKFRSTILKDTNGRIKISLADASQYINTYKERHPKIMQLFDRVAGEVANTGGIKSFYGRFMPVETYKAYAAVNYLIQGTAAYFMKQKMIEVARYLRNHRSKIKLIMTIHDELVFLVPKEEKDRVLEIASLMQDLHTFSVPLTTTISVGANWKDKKEIKRKISALSVG